MKRATLCCTFFSGDELFENMQGQLVMITQHQEIGSTHRHPSRQYKAGQVYRMTGTIIDPAHVKLISVYMRADTVLIPQSELKPQFINALIDGEITIGDVFNIMELVPGSGTWIVGARIEHPEAVEEHTFEAKSVPTLEEFLASNPYTMTTAYARDDWNATMTARYHELYGEKSSTISADDVCKLLKVLWNETNAMSGYTFEEVFGGWGKHLWSSFKERDQNLLRFFGGLDVANRKILSKYIADKFSAI